MIICDISSHCCVQSIQVGAVFVGAISKITNKGLGHPDNSLRITLPNYLKAYANCQEISKAYTAYIERHQSGTAHTRPTFACNCTYLFLRHRRQR
jgi:hypothetical protein